jgi:hypothetical protein
MAELKIYLSKELNEKFRRIAMSIYGYGRGSISKAAEDALAKWCTGSEISSRDKATSTLQVSEVAHSDKAETGINPDERVADSKSPQNESRKSSSTSESSS